MLVLKVVGGLGLLEEGDSEAGACKVLPFVVTSSWTTA